MGIYTHLNNGASVKCSGLMRNALRRMWDTGYFNGRLTPVFYVEPEDGETYISDVFELTHTDMVHVTTLMFQKLFPTSSWKLSWKRRDGRHAQWISTEQAVQLVVVGKHYRAIESEMDEGMVDRPTLNQFAFFRAQKDITPDVVTEWMHWVFITSELMRELDCKGDKPGYLFA